MEGKHRFWVACFLTVVISRDWSTSQRVMLC